MRIHLSVDLSLSSRETNTVTFADSADPEEMDYNELSYQDLHCHAVITKTCLYNSDPLKPHIYIVKLGFTGVYSIFLISAQNHRLWVLVGL